MPTPDPAPTNRPIHVLLVFIDGIGLGPAGAENPFSARYAGLERLGGGSRWLDDLPPRDMPRHVIRHLDANLGLEGLPQSGTGQASLLTGVNCVQLAGRHYGPYPHSATRPVIAAQNVFTRLKESFPDDPEPAAFANAYPDRFFSLAARRDWWTVTTRCCLDAGVRIRDAAALTEGKALSADITGRGWPQHAPAILPVSEEQAAMRLHDLAREHRFTLFEYYLTDKAGHARDERRARAVLSSLDRFIGALVNGTDEQSDLLLVTSDHGNLEDLSTRSHTRNPVPFFAYGARADRFAGADDLTHVVPAIVAALSGA